MSFSKDPEVYKEQMSKLKEAMDKRFAQADKEKGLLMVHTGNGKGKTTAALGMLVRSLGHGYKCAVVQFIKGAMDTAEVTLAKAAPILGGTLSWDRCGQGFTWDVQDKAKDIAHAEEGWAIVAKHLADPDLRFLFLDEINIVLRHEFLPLQQVIDAVMARHPDMHVVMTGRNAPEALMEAADLVTEMRDIKHPFRAGIKAQPGIEF